MIWAAVAVVVMLAACGAAWAVIRARKMDRWLPAYLGGAGKRRDPAPGEDVHLILCVADHFEPKFGGVGPEGAAARVRKWVEEYPRQLARFRDSDGRTPRHTFFYPAEEYEPALLDELAGLCAAGFGEVEIHLHHDNDTPENLARTLAEFRDLLALRHGLLGRDRATGEVAYCFIHGNWALCNSRPDGRLCGVDNEIDVLRATGCRVDMTMPSAPSDTQTPTINSIYYAVNRPGPRSHDRGQPAGDGPPPEGGLMLIQGPLLLDWGRRKFGILPRVENGCIQGTQPATMARVRLWLRARVQVKGRPDWYFVKLYCHGAPEDAHEALLGEPMVRFHEALAEEAARGRHFHYHYVSAREMYNLARAAESGYRGDVAGALDFEVAPGVPSRQTAEAAR
jgi:hypothetical protein